MYPKVVGAPKRRPPNPNPEKNERPPATGPTAWQFTLAGGAEAGFVSGGNDAVLLVYKAPGGYTPGILPRLVPCPVVADTLTVTRWILRREVVVGEKGESGVHEEL